MKTLFSRRSLLRNRRRLRIGKIVLLMMSVLLNACATQPRATLETSPAKHYSAAQLEAIIADEKSCGPAAKQALYDWSVTLR